MRKKIILFPIILFSFMSLFFAKPFLYSISSDSSHSGNYGNNPIQFVNTSNGLQISVSADFSSSGKYIKYCFNIQNKSNKTYYFNENSILAYEGNYETDEWYGLPYKTASSFYAEKEQDIALGTVILGALTLGAILSSDIDIDINVSTPLSFFGKNVYISLFDPDPILEGLALISLFNLIDAKDDVDSLNYLQKALLYSAEIKPNQQYTGVVFVPEGKGPDYRVSFNVSPYESYDFSFARSDRDDILNPWYSRPMWGGYSHDFMLAILGGIPVPNVTGGNIYSIITGSIFGGYLGVSMGFNGINDNNLCGSASDLDYNDLFVYRNRLSNKIPNNYDVRFVDPSEVRQNYTGVYGGFAFTLVPHLTLLAGCGVEFSKSFVYGMFQGKPKNDSDLAYESYGTGWLGIDSKVLCVPQVGVNVAFGIFDFATICDFVITDGMRLNVLFGLAF